MMTINRQHTPRSMDFIGIYTLFYKYQNTWKMMLKEININAKNKWEIKKCFRTSKNTQKEWMTYNFIEAWGTKLDATNNPIQYYWVIELKHPSLTTTFTAIYHLKKNCNMIIQCLYIEKHGNTVYKNKLIKENTTLY